jgi:hypothetical protein
MPIDDDNRRRNERSKIELDLTSGITEMDNKDIEKLFSAMVEDINSIGSTRELTLVVHNYIDYILNLIFTKYFCKVDKERITEFREYVLDKLRPGFQKKINILKHFDLISSDLNKLLLELNDFRNILAHNVSYEEKIKKRSRFLKPYDKGIYIIQLGIMTTWLSNSYSLSNYSRSDRSKMLKKSDEFKQNTVLFNDLFK